MVGHDLRTCACVSGQMRMRVYLCMSVCVCMFICVCVFVSMYVRERERESVSYNQALPLWSNEPGKAWPLIIAVHVHDHIIIGVHVAFKRTKYGAITAVGSACVCMLPLCCDELQMIKCFCACVCVHMCVYI